MRAGEVRSLRLADVDVGLRQVRVLGKGGRERVVPIDRRFFVEVTDYLRHERPSDATAAECFVVLRGPTRGQPMTEAGMRKIFRTHRDRTGAARVRPHRLRHTSGSDLAAAGIDLLVLRELMGHASPETTGKYRAVVRHGGAKRASEAVPTKAEARMLEAKLKLELGSQPSVREQHSVGEVVAGYPADSEIRLSPATLEFYRKGQRALPEAFTRRPVTTVTPLVLDSLYAELREGGASEHKCQKVHRLLSAPFNRAVRDGWLAANPCLQATKPKVSAREIEPPTPEQVRALIADAEEVNEDLVVCLRLAAATGALRGELVALMWSDLVGERLTIRRSVVEFDGVLIERRTKTGSKGHRTIAVDADTLRAVDELRERQAKLAAEHELPKPVYVFSFDAGVTPWRPDYLSMAFGRLSKRTVRLHDLRHYHATQLLSAGVPVATVSKRLGHTSTAVTLNTYSHWLPEQDREAADVMARLLAG